MLPVEHDESFVCDLSSMNLLHWDDWKDTDAVAVLTRFLDAVMTEFINKGSRIPFLDRSVNFARRHRALGIGVLGWHSLLQSKMSPRESVEAMMLNTVIFKTIKEVAYNESELLAERYGEPEKLQGYGRRNATLPAVAPTTSSAFILGQVSQSIEPIKSNYYVRDLAKRKATFRNPYLKAVLAEKGQDTEEVWRDILNHDGSVQHLSFLTDHEKKVFKTFSEISQVDIIRQAGQRQRYIDQAQSLNLMVHPDTPTKDVNALYIQAWEEGVKTLYYQHSINAAQAFNQDLLTCSACES
jgi:ribonucleoside-diphosphate reductase alpha chain